jgi:RHS repeat-associated protein
VFYYHGDHLSTARVITNATGVTQYEADYYPFRGELVITSGSGNNYKFTGRERDSETTLDHTHFRKYSSNLGRWMSPDPWNGSCRAEDPQTWNRYAYVIGDPVSKIDPTGAAPSLSQRTCFNLNVAATYVGTVGLALGFYSNPVSWYFGAAALGIKLYVFVRCY